MSWEGADAATASRWIQDHLAIATGVIFLTAPSSVIVRTAISRWKPNADGDEYDSLNRAGAFIGILERLFVFTFAMGGQRDAVGFLIAAKSVFRFGDLKEASDRKLTEYILIGTLLSVGLAAAVGAVVEALAA